jgi:hypothetical protein
VDSVTFGQAGAVDIEARQELDVKPRVRLRRHVVDALGLGEDLRVSVMFAWLQFCQHAAGAVELRPRNSISLR